MDRDRDLLFGVLAVQLKLISPQKLMETAAMWATSQKKPLREILVEQGYLSAEKKKLIENLLEIQIKEHNGDPKATLQSFGGNRAVYESFAGSILVEKDEIKLSYQAAPDLGQKPVSEELDDDTRLSIEQPGRYSIKGEHDRGGIGRIMLGVDEFIGRSVAIKELLPDQNPDGTPVSATPLSKTAAAIARFLREARITGQLEHPGIVPIYEIGKRADGSLYYTMKFVRGKNFSVKLKECKNLQERLRLLSNFLSLCQAVAYAHSKKVIHRDLKPANVMIGEFGETIVLDWGLAKVKGLEDIRASQITESLRLLKETSVGITTDGLPLGTPAYMSPEQADGKIEDIDERSDIWGLGAVLYEILTGCLPFTGTTVYEVMGKIITDPIVPIQEVEPKAPAELCAIAEKCLQKNPKDRYQSAEELAEDLTNFQAGGLVGAFEYPIWRLIGRWFKRHWPQLAIGTAGFAVAIILICWLIPTIIYQFLPKKNISPEALEAISLVKEDARLSKFFPLPSGPGNAAQDLMQASHHSICFVGGCKPRLPYDWIEQVKYELVKSDKPEDWKKLREWSQIPEVDIFRGTAQRGGYQMWGVEIFPQPGVHWMEQHIPNFLDFLRLARLGMVRARIAEEQGDLAGALAWYQDLLRIGNILEGDMLIGMMIGIVIKTETSEQLALFYERQSHPELAKQWRDYLEIQKQRRKLIKENIIHILYLIPEPDLKSVIDNPEISPGIRSELYWWLLMRMNYSTPRRFFLGPSQEDREYLFGDHFDRPELKLWQLVAVTEVEKGFISRMFSGGKVIYVWIKMAPFIK